MTMISNPLDKYAIPEMEYNTDRPALPLPEYGRHVQSMVDYCMTLNEREHRNAVAQSIIDVIGNLNPQIRDTPDFKHKLWDHLFIMSDFKLDVDSPYPIPTQETFVGKPERVEYPSKSSKYRHYGNIIRDMITKAATMENGEERDAFILAIANQMKRSYLAWNKDTVDDSVIWQELRALSQGQIDISGSTLANANSIGIPSTGGTTQKNKNFKNRNNRNNNNKKPFKKFNNRNKN